MNVLEILKAVPLFNGIKETPGALEALSQVMTHQIFKKGEPILEEGKIGNELYFLAVGQVSISRKTADGLDSFKVAILKAEQHPFFGEGALLASDIRSASAIADVECKCLVLTRDNFEKFCETNPSWGLPVLRHVSDEVMRRLRKVNKDLILLYKALIEEIRGE